MITHKQMAHGSMGGAAIAVITFIGNITRIGYIIDPILVPLCLMFIKQKNKNMPMYLPLVVAGALIFFYKFYLVFFLMCYWLLAETTWRIGKKLNLKNIFIISIIYAFGYYTTWAFIARFIHGYEWNQILFLFTGISSAKRGLIAFVLIIEPLIYSMALILALEKIKRYKL